MIRRGRLQGRLTCSSDSFLAWTQLNEVALHEVRIANISGKGAALVASRNVSNTAAGAECLLTVPRSLILSLESTQQHALVDRDYREVLGCLGEFGKTARGATLSFLLLQLSTACTLDESIGVHSPFTHYIESLPEEALPTTWTEDELQLLISTTLAPATIYKLKSLHKEYDNLCDATRNTRWWSVVGDVLEFEDWIIVDSMYRSRALDYPNIGHCMVPCLDIANHEPGDATIAVYDLDSEGNAILGLRNGKTLSEGDEVTISYGDEKGACEMIHSYGFLEAERETAEALYLDLSPLSSDEFGQEKRRFAECAPGVKIIDTGEGQIDWTGDFIWLLCLFADDGLHFDIAQLVDGTQEIQAFWNGQELTNGAAGLRAALAHSSLWDFWRLRAVSFIQTRIQQQMSGLINTQGQMEDTARGDGTDIDSGRYDLAMRLRTLEFDLLDRANDYLDQEIQELCSSEVVIQQLQRQQAEQSEDFS